MAKYTVRATVTVSLFKQIEAATRAEAEEKALELGVPSLCFQCASAGSRHSDTWQLSDGLDGEPESIEAEG